MTRPRKKGLDHFPFDVDFFSDRKIKRLRAKFGNYSVSVYIYLLCEIYRKCYFTEFDKDLILDISDELNIPENVTKQIINYLLSRSLFDGKLAESVKVLTAESVQQRYLKAKGLSAAAIEDQYLLIILTSIAKCPIDFEVKFCQTRSKPQDVLSHVEDLRRRMAKF